MGRKHISSWVEWSIVQQGIRVGAEMEHLGLRRAEKLKFKERMVLGLARRSCEEHPSRKTMPQLRSD